MAGVPTAIGGNRRCPGEKSCHCPENMSMNDNHRAMNAMLVDVANDFEREGIA
jgi:hypothetical protein